MPKLVQTTPRYPQSGEALDNIARLHRVTHKSYRQNKAADVMGISRAKFSLYINGMQLPTPEDCLAIAHYFDVPVEKVLQFCGYPILQDLYDFAESLDPRTAIGEREKSYLIKMLHIALFEEWRLLGNTSPWKTTAEQLLARSTNLYTKARGYADQVRGWDLERRQGEETTVLSGEFVGMAHAVLGSA